jgi:DnaJ like chaperone protein
MFMEMQIATVFADGHIDDSERKILFYIGNKLGFSEYQLTQLIAMIQAARSYREQQYGTAQESVENKLREAYKILGVEPDASDRDVKTAYRKLMSQHHPDKLVSKGLPKEMIEIATQKTQEIKEAYETIVAYRKKH